MTLTGCCPKGRKTVSPAQKRFATVLTLTALRPFLYGFKRGPLFLISAWMFLFHANDTGAAEDWLLSFFGGFAVGGVLSVNKAVMGFLYRIAQFDEPVEGQDRTVMITAETLALPGSLMAAIISLNEFQPTGFGM